MNNNTKLEIAVEIIAAQIAMYAKNGISCNNRCDKNGSNIEEPGER